MVAIEIIDIGGTYHRLTDALRYELQQFGFEKIRVVDRSKSLKSLKKKTKEEKDGICLIIINSLPFQLFGYRYVLINTWGFELNEDEIKDAEAVWCASNAEYERVEKLAPEVDKYVVDLFYGHDQLVEQSLAGGKMSFDILAIGSPEDPVLKSEMSMFDGSNYNILPKYDDNLTMMLGRCRVIFVPLASGANEYDLHYYILTGKKVYVEKGLQIPKRLHKHLQFVERVAEVKVEETNSRIIRDIRIDLRKRYHHKEALLPVLKWKPIERKTKQRIALCLSGFVRNGIEAYPSIKAHLLDPLNPDVFIDSYYSPDFAKLTDCSYKKKVVRDEITLEEIVQLYRPKDYRFEWYGTDFLEREIFPGPGQEVLAADSPLHQIMKSVKIPNTLCMYRKIQRANDLKRYYEYEHGFEYDIVIRCRFDLLLRSPLDLDLINRLKNNESVFVVGGMTSDTGIVDQLAIGTSPAIDRYSRLYSHIGELFPKMIEEGAIKSPFAERVLKYYLLKHCNFTCYQLPMHLDLRTQPVMSVMYIKFLKLLKNQRAICGYVTDFGDPPKFLTEEQLTKAEKKGGKKAPKPAPKGKGWKPKAYQKALPRR